MHPEDKAASHDKAPMVMMATEHYASYRWVHAPISALALWLMASPFTLGCSRTALVWSDVISGTAVLLMSLFALKPTRGLVAWSISLVGLWLLFAPLLFWAPEAVVYANDTLVGALLIAFGLIIPMGMKMKGAEVPPGWSYNPSAWPQRAPVIALAFVSFLVSRYMAAYQLGYISTAWDPFFGGATERVLTSDVSKAWPVSDAGLGAMTYMIEVLMGLMGDQRRWRTMPWMVAGFGVIVVPLGIVSIALVIMQPLAVGAWCSPCLFTAAAMLLMIPLSLDEVVAMVQLVARKRREGHSAWRVFWLGAHLPDETPTWEPPRPATWRPRGMLWGFTNTWSLWFCVAAGIWLMFAPAAFGIGIEQPAADSNHLVGAIIIVVAIIALAEVARPLRFLNVVAGLWLITAPWFLQGATSTSQWNSAAMGLLVVLLSMPLGKLRDHYGTFDKIVLWSPRSAARARHARQQWGPRPDDLPLSSYGLIGNGRTAALVAEDGAIDWLCYGRFDGPAIFCRLLDAARGGFLQVAPECEFRARHHYVGDTNVLATEFESAAGTLRVTDCMRVPCGGAPVLLRKVEVLAGEVPVRLDFFPTPDFALTRSCIEVTQDGCSARWLGGELRLAWASAMKVVDNGATSSVRMREGERRWAVVTHGERPMSDDDAEAALRATLDGWENWSARGHYPPPYAHLLRRSALALKLLIHSDSGAMVAAPTTSLPEILGGARNWDYRFTWLRDASWVVSGLMDLGYHDESMAFIDWLERLNLIEGDPSVFYDLDGRVPSNERELTHLRGYGSSRPVRIGNGAAGQDQHDVFGEVVAAIYTCSEGMPAMRPLRPGLWKLVSALADKAATHWEHADHGMWEVRDQRRHFLSSKLLSWVALDRAIAIAKRDRLSGPVVQWDEARTRLRNVILDDGFDRKLQSFRRALGEHELDAAALLLPRYGLLSASDPRMTATVQTLERELATPDGLLRRYVAPDGLSGEEGAFVACSFWLADCLARQGRLQEAQRVFERTAGHATELGLFSEEICSTTGLLLGNYPQAFTHLALIRAAMTIAQCGVGPSQRRKGEHAP